MDQMEEGSVHTVDQVLSEVDPLERGMSDDEGLSPDLPIFTGLFRPQLFKSLLFKAKNTTWLDNTGTPPTPNITGEAEDLIFSQPVIEAEVIPVPHMFSNLVQKQWAAAASYPTPTGHDKKYNLHLSSLNF
uniref:Uncharacterized protein n=1 Tax=Micrurus lemniscatus lemniscatus TaxID=129467 RepID=A0A2D4J936_MICLE